MVFIWVLCLVWGGDLWATPGGTQKLFLAGLRNHIEYVSDNKCTLLITSKTVFFTVYILNKFFLGEKNGGRRVWGSRLHAIFETESSTKPKHQRPSRY